ncbi:hypothetical protein ACQ4PT_032064 [Festuca glaucescens]
MPLKALVVLVGWLKDGVFLILPFVSLILYLILAAFSDSRRRKVKGFWRSCLWVAYDLNDWAPAYVISNLYLETSPHDKVIVAFWVSFLLLHQARPDNISAYAMEDSELWIRSMFPVLLESMGCAYILYWYIIVDCTAGTLRYASGIMTFLGIFKYLESAAAQRQCNLDIMGRSFNQQKISSSFDGDYSDEKALLVAHDLFEICKGAFCHYTADRDRDAINSMFSGQSESMCKVVEMELSLTYDILYTKVAMVHTWHGYAIRLASPLLTAAALLLFGLYCKEGMKPADEGISYILLLTTFLFDVRWLFRALASSWTHSYFKRRPHSWLKHEFWCQGRWEKLRGFVTSLPLSRLSLWLWTCECHKEPKSYRRWAGTFGQHNLLDQCTAGNRQTSNSIPQRALGPAEHSRSRGFEWEDHSSGVEIPEHVKELVFSNICEKLFALPAGPTTSPEQIHISVDNDSPPWQLQPPEHPVMTTNNRPPTQLRMKMRVKKRSRQRSPGPEQLKYNAPARPDDHPEEQAAEDHWRYAYEYEARLEAYEQAEYWMYDQNRYTCNEGMPDIRERDDDQAKACTAQEDDDTKSMESEEDMGFPPELQEVILIWHIATDIFLLCSPGNRNTDRV